MPAVPTEPEGRFESTSIKAVRQRMVELLVGSTMASAASPDYPHLYSWTFVLPELVRNTAPVAIYPMITDEDAEDELRLFARIFNGKETIRATGISTRFGLDVEEMFDPVNLASWEDVRGLIDVFEFGQNYIADVTLEPLSSQQPPVIKCDSFFFDVLDLIVAEGKILDIETLGAGGGCDPTLTGIKAGRRTTAKLHAIVWYFEDRDLDISDYVEISVDGPVRALVNDGKGDCDPGILVVEAVDSFLDYVAHVRQENSFGNLPPFTDVPQCENLDGGLFDENLGIHPDLRVNIISNYVNWNASFPDEENESILISSWAGFDDAGAIGPPFGDYAEVLELIYERGALENPPYVPSRIIADAPGDINDGEHSPVEVADQPFYEKLRLLALFATNHGSGYHVFINHSAWGRAEVNPLSAPPPNVESCTQLAICEENYQIETLESFETYLDKVGLPSVVSFSSWHQNPKTWGPPSVQYSHLDTAYQVFLAANRSPRGQIFELDGNGDLSGFAADPDDILKPVQVSLYGQRLGDPGVTLLQTLTADILDQRIADDFGINKAHGYLFAVPAAFQASGTALMVHATDPEFPQVTTVSSLIVP